MNARLRTLALVLAPTAALPLVVAFGAQAVPSATDATTPAAAPSVGFPVSADPGPLLANPNAPDNTSKTYLVSHPKRPLTVAERTALGGAGAAIEITKGNGVQVSATEAAAAAVRALGLTVTPQKSDADVANERADAYARTHGIDTRAAQQTDEFPPGQEAYHTYAEVLSELDATAQRNPSLAQVFSMGKSVEGRDLRAIKISDNVTADEREPEILITCNVHAREHLTAEQCLYVINELVGKYATDARIKKIVDTREIYVLPMQNPDGAMFDIKGRKFQSWRKTRHNNGGSYGIDPNRNYGYMWGKAASGSSTDPSMDTYRGTKPFQAVEVAAIRDFVNSRKIGGKQQIQGHMDVHTYSELILWPYGYMENTLDANLNQDQYNVFEKLGKDMARTNSYAPKKSSGLYLSDGTSTDWAWGEGKMWSWTIELHPKGRVPGFYPKADVIPQETQRNREAFLMFMEHADCYYKATGKQAQFCRPGEWDDSSAPGPTQPQPQPSQPSQPTPWPTQPTAQPSQPAPWPTQPQPQPNPWPTQPTQPAPQPTRPRPTWPGMPGMPGQP